MCRWYYCLLRPNTDREIFIPLRIYAQICIITILHTVWPEAFIRGSSAATEKKRYMIIISALCRSFCYGWCWCWGCLCCHYSSIFSRLYIVTIPLRFRFVFFLDFMIALRARWNSRDQLTDNYHIALIRDVSLEIYFIVAEILIHCLHAIDGYVWLLLSHSFSVSKDKQISSFFGNVAEERWNVIPSFSRDN